MSRASALPARPKRSSRSRATRPAIRVPPSARVRRAARQQPTAAASPATRGRTAGRAWRAQPRHTRLQTAPHRAPLALQTQDTFSSLRRPAQRVCVTRGTLAKRARRVRRASTRRRRAQTRARRVQQAHSRRQAVTAPRTACVWPATKSLRMLLPFDLVFGGRMTEESASGIGSPLLTSVDLLTLEHQPVG